MGFFSPWFLAGLAAVGLPFWLHLLKKHRNVPLPFSSLMFFEQRTQSSVKHRRLRYLVLFALRTALFVLLALAFANPYIMRKSAPISQASEVTVLAVDNSLSMRAGGRLDEAKRMAKAAAGRVRPGQRAQVAVFSSRVQMMSEVTDDKAALSAAVDAIQPSDGRTSFGELARALRSMERSLKTPLAVHIYSDMQQSGMPASFNDLRLDEGIRLEAHTLGGKAPNFTVENVVAPRRVYDNRKSRVLATVAGWGTDKATRTVSLVLNNRTVETRSVEAPANGRATVEFLSLEAPYGQNKGEVRIDSADSLPQDDHFYFSVERAEPARALFVRDPQSTRALLYFKAALDASGQSAFEIDAAAPEQAVNIDPSKYAFVVLSDIGNVPGAFETALRNYVNSGGSVLVSLGHNSTARMRVPVSDGVIEQAQYATREGARFQTPTWLDASHPSISQGANWGDVKFYQAVRVNPGAARVAARLSDDTPLLLDQQAGEGRILVFASTFDNVANDFPLHSSFVPFIEHTANYLGKLDSGAGSVLVGSYADLRNRKEKGAAVEVIEPGGGRALSLEEGTRAQSVQFTQAGYYEIHRANGRAETVAVNADRHESDLAPVPEETLALWRNTAKTPVSASETVSGERKPVSLWWYALIAALAVAISESLLGNRHLSVDKEAA